MHRETSNRGSDTEAKEAHTHREMHAWEYKEPR